MEMSIRESLTALERSFFKLGRTNLMDVMQRGIDAAHVQHAMSEAGLRSTRDLEVLYGWRNGVAPDTRLPIGEISLWPGFYFLSIEEAVANYLAFVKDSRWQKGWFPVFADGGGDFYVVDLSVPHRAPIRDFRLEESEHPIEFASLADMLRTLALGYEQECFFLKQNGFLDMDDERFEKLAARLNPGVDWWR